MRNHAQNVRGQQHSVESVGPLEDGQSPPGIGDGALTVIPPHDAVDAGNGNGHRRLSREGSASARRSTSAGPLGLGRGSQWGVHQMYRYLFENQSTPMWIYELETLRFLEVNDAAVKRYGYSREEFLRMTLRDIRTPDLLAIPGKRRSTIRILSQSGSSLHRAKDGSLLKGEITSQVLSFGNRRARIVMEQDVTLKVELDRQLQQAQRLESLGQLAGGVAHDFNNLLVVILNVTALLKTQVQATPEEEWRWKGAIRDLERVEKAAQSASRLTRQLLAFARREIVQQSVIDLTPNIADLTDLLRRTLGSHIVLETSLQPDLWPVLMDPGHLEQVVINLS